MGKCLLHVLTFACRRLVQVGGLWKCAAGSWWLDRVLCTIAGPSWSCFLFCPTVGAATFLTWFSVCVHWSICWQYWIGYFGDCECCMSLFGIESPFCFDLRYFSFMLSVWRLVRMVARVPSLACLCSCCLHQRCLCGLPHLLFLIWLCSLCAWCCCLCDLCAWCCLAVYGIYNCSGLCIGTWNAVLVVVLS